MTIYIIKDSKIREIVFNIGHKIWAFPQFKFASEIRFKGPLNRDDFFILVQQGPNSS